MALDFSKVNTQANQQPTATMEKVGTPENPIVEPVQQYDIVADRQQMNKELVNSAEVDALVSKIEVNNMESIVTFGGEVADEISKASDVVLNSMNLAQLEQTSTMLKQLSSIMSKFDIDEIKDEPKGLSKWFSNAKKQLDKILAKYHTMGDEVDKI